LKIEAVKKDLIVAIEKVNVSIEKVKASINTQIAKWVLGVSAIQTMVLIALIRSIH
jgi:L-rhamnose isomerase